MPSMVAVPTFTNGSVPTATQLGALATDVDTLAQLTIGRTAASGAGARPAVKVVLLNPQSLASSTLTMITYGAATVDTDHMWTPSAGGTVTIRTAGWYRIESQVAYDTASAGLRINRVFVNGTTDPTNGVASSEVEMGSPSPDNIRVQCRTYEHLAVGAVVRVAAYQNSGGAINLLPTTQWGTWLVVAWDAPY